MIEQDYGLVQQSHIVVWDLRLHSTTQWYCWLDFMFKQGPRQDRVFSHGFKLCFRIRWGHRHCHEVEQGCMLLSSLVGWDHRLPFFIGQDYWLGFLHGQDHRLFPASGQGHRLSSSAYQG